jgi:hypothetical protein
MFFLAASSQVFLGGCFWVAREVRTYMYVNSKKI